MSKVYEECPILENNNFLLRLISIEDASDLLKVYSDKKAVPFFNNDNCSGDGFFCDDLGIMKEISRLWRMEYDNKGFVRFSIVDKKSNEVIGTIELFNRISEDYYNNCGFLRLDIRSDYEDEDSIYQILSIIVPDTYELFSCEFIATKAIPDAALRIKALKKLGFEASSEKVVGNDGTKYGDYWIVRK